MKQSVLVVLSIVALIGCSPQPSSQTGAGTQPTYAAGSPSNTTGAFDGTYTSVAIQNISQGNTLGVAGGNSPITCQDYRNQQPVTINNGLGQFQLLGYTFQGYVTPQGRLKMISGF